MVKLYADEDGHEAVRAVDALVVSAIARVEVPAALWRKQRLGELLVADASRLTRAFEVDYGGSESGEPPRLVAVAATAGVLEAAAGLVAVHPLRAYDAVQLASAMTARRAEPDCQTFACFDSGLRAAAARSGFRLLPECD